VWFLEDWGVFLSCQSYVCVCVCVCAVSHTDNAVGLVGSSMKARQLSAFRIAGSPQLMDVVEPESSGSVGKWLILELFRAGAVPEEVK